MPAPRAIPGPHASEYVPDRRNTQDVSENFPARVTRIHPQPNESTSVAHERSDRVRRPARRSHSTEPTRGRGIDERSEDSANPNVRRSKTRGVGTGGTDRPSRGLAVMSATSSRPIREHLARVGATEPDHHRTYPCIPSSNRHTKAPVRSDGCHGRSRSHAVRRATWRARWSRWSVPTDDDTADIAVGSAEVVRVPIKKWPVEEFTQSRNRLPKDSGVLDVRRPP